MAVKRVIDVRKQEKLSLGKSVRICVRGIVHRLLRSSLTLAVVVLAVAFFMALLAENSFVSSVSRGVAEETRALREAHNVLAFLATAPGTVELAADLARAADKPSRLAVYAGVAGVPEQDVRSLAADCCRERLYTDFFDRMNVGRRIILVKKHTGRDVFRFLADNAGWQHFEANLRPLRSVEVPGGVAELKQFADRFTQIERRQRDFTSAWAAALGRLAEHTREITGPSNLGTWLTTADPEQLARWLTLVQERGFRMDMDTVLRMRNSLVPQQRRQDIARLLNTPEKRRLWKQTFLETLSLDDKIRRIADERVASVILDGRYAAEELLEVQRLATREKRLLELTHRLTGKTESHGESLLSGRQAFLLMVSFVVCMVGIANAMLMSITERFREIATMKCLGATDGFILAQFLMEAGIQGITGALAGMVIGLTLSLLKNSMLLGGYVYRYFPVGSLALSSLLAIAAGVILSMAASVYPSWAASRMAPMEAMRIE